ncbi:hypothetical protein WOLCODRAFT_154641 [Wolfiporia cocos MD-104 SS10]|uniref:Uncharacterized protein n=1 Tax=Wolfiporia cocos (strain MD-104) TaxID=742152 RepID=A0A2H3JRP1_WOLCO|nr:hypothetical protein WOLCODRAFT_154641 [Wolfiporia cocos MD-104 SS10]
MVQEIAQMKESLLSLIDVANVLAKGRRVVVPTLSVLGVSVPVAAASIQRGGLLFQDLTVRDRGDKPALILLTKTNGRHREDISRMIGAILSSSSVAQNEADQRSVRVPKPALSGRGVLPRARAASAKGSPKVSKKTMSMRRKSALILHKEELRAVDRTSDRINENREDLQLSATLVNSPWRVATPAPSHELSRSAPLPPPPGNPRIWTTSKEELCEVLPSLSRSINGVVWGTTQIPVVFLEGQAWYNDSWVGKTIKVTMARQFTLPPPQISAPPQNMAQPVSLPDAAHATPVSSNFHDALVQAGPHVVQVIPTDTGTNTTQTPPHSSSSANQSADESSIYTEPIPSLDTPASHHTQPGVSTNAMPYDPELIHMSSPLENEHAHANHGDGHVLYHKDRPSPSMIMMDVNNPNSFDYQPQQIHHDIQLSDSSLVPPILHHSGYVPLQLCTDHVSTSGSSELQSRHDPSTMTNKAPELSQQYSPGISASFEAPSPPDLVPSPPSSPPPEIQVLLDSHQSRFPVSIVLCRDSKLAPFSLHEQYGCTYLGYFEIKSVDMARNDADQQQFSWQFTFEWVPGGDTADPSADSPTTPWWMVPPSVGAGQTDNDVVLYLFSFLPLRLSPNHYTDADFEYGIAATSYHGGWQCVKCGKLNAQRNLWYQLCSGCSESNRIPPVEVHTIRDPRNIAPVTYPWNRLSDCIKTTVMDVADGSRLFAYTIQDGVSAKHIFTCNEAELQKEPTRLFREILTKVELPSLRGGRGASKGAYYTSSFDYRNATTATAHAPLCISQARALIQSRSAAEGGEPPEINHLTVIGWVIPGSKKNVLAAKNSPVYMMCLGADAELSIRPKSLAPGAQQLLPIAVTERGSLEEELPHEADDSYEPMDIDDPDVAVPSNSANIMDMQVTGSVTKPVKWKGVLFVTLGHGDILIFNGDDFEYSLNRTGMSIVLIGSR